MVLKSFSFLDTLTSQPSHDPMFTETSEQHVTRIEEVFGNPQACFPDSCPTSGFQTDHKKPGYHQQTTALANEQQFSGNAWVVIVVYSVLFERTIDSDAEGASDLCEKNRAANLSSPQWSRHSFASRDPPHKRVDRIRTQSVAVSRKTSINEYVLAAADKEKLRLFSRSVSKEANMFGKTSLQYDIRKTTSEEFGHTRAIKQKLASIKSVRTPTSRG